jgi:hypothetical protein
MSGSPKYLALTILLVAGCSGDSQHGKAPTEKMPARMAELLTAMAHRKPLWEGRPEGEDGYSSLYELGDGKFQISVDACSSWEPTRTVYAKGELEKELAPLVKVASAAANRLTNEHCQKTGKKAVILEYVPTLCMGPVVDYIFTCK